MMRWFRMYHELLDDPKVQRLSGDEFKGWVNLLCLASKNGGALPPIGDIAFALRLPETQIETLLETLHETELLDSYENWFIPHNWNGRQYHSDCSTDRVRKHRKDKAKPRRKRNVSPAVPVTPPDTDTDTEDSVPNGTARKDVLEALNEEIYRRGKSLVCKAEGKADSTAGGIVTRWLKASHDNHSAVLTAIQECEGQSPPVGEPTSWIMQRVSVKGKPKFESWREEEARRTREFLDA